LFFFQYKKKFFQKLVSIAFENPRTSKSLIGVICLWLEMNLALRDSFGSWKENIYIHKTPNACTSIKKLIGNAATAFAHGFGLKSLSYISGKNLTYNTS